jgi:glycosyltransferase involved in cell wall biosynthesis
MQRPLLTHVVLGYNQAGFISEAVAGAFSQTYSPLEVILSDDASGDGTFEVMRKMSEKYKGPHSVKLNRNERQMGIGGHLDKVAEVARGELMILNAGDDISLAERSEVIFRAWDLSGRMATSIYSDYTSISETGAILERAPSQPVNGGPVAWEYRTGTPRAFVETVQPLVSGCTHAVAPSLFTFFGPLTRTVTYEDMALSFRSHAIGAMIYVKHPLLLYRRHSNNISFHVLDQGAIDGPSYLRLEEKERKKLRGWIRGYERMHSDIGVLADRGCLKQAEVHELELAVSKEKRNLELKLVLVEGGFVQRLKALHQLYDLGHRGTYLLRLAPRCLPRCAYRNFRIVKNKLLSQALEKPYRSR